MEALGEIETNMYNMTAHRMNKKKLAAICVDYILAAKPRGCGDELFRTSFWREVKKEIEKL